VGAKSDFWWAIHNVCLCLEQEGLTPEERAKGVAEAWSSMPRSARLVIAQELRTLLFELPNVESELLRRQMSVMTRESNGNSFT
jgi:hypothetical protein